jgi:PKD repeat protein
MFYARVYLRVMPNTEAEPYDQYTVTLTDDVGTWNVGDKLVIASTDFNMNQAEEVEVVSVAGNVLSFKGMCVPI